MKNAFKIIILFLFLIDSKYLSADQGKNHFRGVKGTEPIKIHSLSKMKKCFYYYGYAVMTIASNTEVGEEIRIYKTKGNKGNNCSENMHTPYFTFEKNNENWAFYFFGIADNFLFIDSGTGPDYRTIYVYDLTKKVKIFEDGYFRPISFNDNNLIFNQEYEPKDSDKPICPDAKKWEDWGLTVAYERKVIIDLETNNKKITNDSKCAARQ